MRQLFPIFVLITTLATAACAQDSGTPQDPRTAQSRSGDDGYGGRAEIFATGFGLFGNRTTGNAIGQRETGSGGGSVGYRFHLNAASALEGRYGFSRDSQKYTIGGTTASVPAYLSEISGSYVYSLARSAHLQPFLEGGGGLLIFIPGNYGGSAIAPGAGVPSNSYSIYSGVPAVVRTQAKGMFVYGGGLNVPALPHVDVRIEVRGLAYKTPDFGAGVLQINAFTFVYEPALGVAYRF